MADQIKAEINLRDTFQNQNNNESVFDRMAGKTADLISEKRQAYSDDSNVSWDEVSTDFLGSYVEAAKDLGYDFKAFDDAYDEEINGYPEDADNVVIKAYRAANALESFSQDIELQKGDLILFKGGEFAVLDSVEYGSEGELLGANIVDIRGDVTPVDFDSVKKIGHTDELFEKSSEEIKPVVDHTPNPEVPTMS